MNGLLLIKLHESTLYLKLSTTKTLESARNSKNYDDLVNTSPGLKNLD